MSLGKKTEFGNVITPFYKMGIVTYKILSCNNWIKGYFSKVGDKLKIIYPRYKEKEITEMYIAYKFMTVYAFIAAGLLLFLVYNSVITGENKITELGRQDYWGEDEIKQIVAITEGQENPIDVTISHQEISEETLRRIIEDKAGELPDFILGDNISVDTVTDNLNLISQIPDTQINVFWEIEENDVLLPDGTVHVENIKEGGDLVKLKATLNYEEIQVETEFVVKIIEPELSKENQLKINLNKLIQEADSATVSEESLSLPKEIDGKNITYAYQGKDNGKLIFPVMFVICIPLLFLAQDEKLEKQKIKRERQMLIDYPEIINKLILYLGAGLTIQGAFEMISFNYMNEKNRKKCCERFAYEEIVYMCREVQGGIGFNSSLENFAVRCKVQSFRKLTALLLQNLKKGSSELVGLLHNEAVNAFEIRKSAARKLGEEAGTKMLFPMILCLGVVLVILIVPAWMSFQF